MDIVDYDEDLRPSAKSTEGVNKYGEMKDKPGIEQQLFALQDVYLNPDTDDDEKRETWIKMFSLIKVYARSYVLHKLKNKKFLDPDTVEGHANQAATNFMSQYLNRQGFNCAASFGKMLNYKVIETVYGKKDDDHVLSLQVENNSGDEYDFISMQKKVEAESLWGNDYEDTEETAMNSMTTMEEYIDEILDEFDSEVPSQLFRLKLRMYFLLILKKPKNRHIKEQFIRYNCMSKREIDLLQLFELELHNRFLNYHASSGN